MKLSREELPGSDALNRGKLYHQNVLVTGATGFVGRPLCEQLLLNGCSVRACVRSTEVLPSLPGDVQATAIASIGADTDWSAALAGIDIVIHLAARVHVMDETADAPLTAYRLVNVAGTESLARQAAAAGVRRLVFLSSVKVHGEESDTPYSEENQPAPQDPYGVSKRQAEEILHTIAAETGLEVVIIRPPLVYGPGVKANFLKLLKIVERGIPLPLAGINNARSLIYLGNLIDAIMTCATHPRAVGEIFLVSDNEDVSTPQLLRQVAMALNRPSRLFPFPLSLMRLAGKLTSKSMAVDRLFGSLVVDSGKIRRELGWQPPYTLAEGIATTVTWYKDRDKSRF